MFFEHILHCFSHNSHCFTEFSDIRDNLSHAALRFLLLRILHEHTSLLPFCSMMAPHRSHLSSTGFCHTMKSHSGLSIQP